MRVWRWFGITFPWLDFAIGAGLGVFMDWFQPPTHDYPVPTWLGFGVSFIALCGLFRFFYAIAEREWPDDS